MKTIRLAVLGVALLLGGCASTTQVITDSTNTAPGGTAHHLLLVAQTPEDAMRETWELTCRPIFRQRGLQVALSHQEMPLWQDQGGRPALLHWARQHGVDRVLIVNITQLLMQPPQMPHQHELNALQQGDESQPALRVGIGGSYHKPVPPPVEQGYPAELLDADGDSLWYGEIRTHEANDSAAIARSQCTALRDAFVKQGLIP